MKEKFINPLLKLTGLTENQFFIVPGNHEVDRKSISEFVDGDLSDRFKDRDSLNRFIDQIEDQKQLLARLNNYNTFVDDFHKNNDYLNTVNSLYRTYILPIKDKRIGLACLNSAWCAYGGEEDYGKILLGERQLDNALKDLEAADYKIAMIHHPVEWNKEFDKEYIHDILIPGFNMILTGHVHSQKYMENVYDNYNSIFLQSASLFQGRTYNGYSILKIDFDSNDLTVLFREYFEGGRRVFGKAERIAEDGMISIPLDKKNNHQLIKGSIKTKKELRDKASSDINNKLLSVASDSIAPKSITEIFVPPILTTHSESSDRANKEIMDEEDTDLDSIVYSDENMLLIGKKEIGKTTLLNFIFNSYLTNPENLKIPIIVNFDELPAGKNVFYKATQNFLINYDIKDFDVEENLTNGNCVFLIDNFNLKKDKNIQKLYDFAEAHPTNRFIITMNEDILQTMKLKELPDVGFDYKTFYINTFRRGQVRELVKKWFMFKDVNDDLILDRVMESIKSIGMPRTPMFISLMLWVLERQSNFIPVNEASLIENFIETLLEKLHPDDIKYETVGYKIKIDFLTYLAKHMINAKEFNIDIPTFEKKYVEYFASKGLEISSTLKQTFFDKGILIYDGGKVYFRFSCFLEYFIALEMQEDKELFDFIVCEENYLEFTNEIIYYTGLNQKNKSFEVLKIVESRLLEAFKEIDEIIDLAELAQLPIEETIFSEIDDGNVSQKVEKLKLSEEEKDIILDESDSSLEQSHIKRKNRPKMKDGFINSLELYSNILKNSELIDIEYKIGSLEIAIEKYCKSMGLIYKVLYDFYLKEILEREDDLDRELLNMITVGIPLVVQSMIMQNIGTPKLKVSIEKLIPNAKTEFEKLMLVCLYGDLRLDGYIDLFEEVFKSTESKLIKEITRVKLMYYQTFYSMNKKEEEKLVSLIAEVIIDSQKIKDPYAKGNIKQKILKHNMLNKPQKIID